MEGILFYEYGTILRLDDDGRVVLDVLCGTVGQYGVEFALNHVEYAAYKARGDEYIKELAAAVLREPDRYSTRGRGMNANPYKSPETLCRPIGAHGAQLGGLYVSRAVPAMLGVVGLLFSFVFASTYASGDADANYLVFAVVALGIATTFFYIATKFPR
jgi:hypothetical protein